MLIKYHNIQIILIILSYLVHSQSFDIYDNSIQLKDWNYNFNQNKYSNSFHSSAKSVKLENTTNELLDPIIQLNSSETLSLSFDILDTESKSYAYTFIHCSSNWEYSDIIQSEYLSGFFDNYINEYEYSFNTLNPYVHYQFSFPNENINFTKSGNYILLVYDVEDNKPIITKRFMVHEKILNINMRVKKATLSKDLMEKQEIDFYIEGHQKLSITDPHNDLKIIIQQNDDWNNTIKNCKPNFIYNNKLEYDYQEEISFLGGSEYRDFDMKSLRYYGKNIRSIEQHNLQGFNVYSITLQNDKIEYSDEYEFKYDLNGKYVLSVSENRNKYTEGDYALVKFTLQSNQMNHNNIYIYGELTNWDITKEGKMNYNEKNQEYYAFLYLKQGYYNYQYVVKEKDEIIMLGGNYHETRNQYSIYAYYTPPWGNYDRLVGMSKSTSNALN